MEHRQSRCGGCSRRSRGRDRSTVIHSCRLDARAPETCRRRPLAGQRLYDTSSKHLEIRIMTARQDRTLLFTLCLGFGLLVPRGTAQQRATSPTEKYPENPTKQENAPSPTARLGRLTIEWII